MTAAQVFTIANPFALLGWAVLAAAVALKRPWLRDVAAGQLWPLALAVLYVVALAAGWGASGGNFSSLAGVRQLFSADWTLLAGWVHYLAFDLFVGAWIAAAAERAGLTRLWLIPVLPLTFLFGPAGFLLFFVIRSTVAGRTA
jgi:hypothetical protein